MNTPSSLYVEAIKTPLYDSSISLLDFLKKNLQAHNLESKVLIITSKIVSLSEYRQAPKSVPKDQIVQKEADHYLGAINYDVHLTIKNGLLIPSAGIDESNSPDGNYILYPENPVGSCKKIYDFLKKEFSLSQLGVILSDSHTTPLRKGVTGVALAHWGFLAVENKEGSPDLFGSFLKYTSMNWADSLASSATILMGEANECHPLALITCPQVTFTEKENTISIPLEQDLYYPILRPLLTEN